MEKLDDQICVLRKLRPDRGAALLYLPVPVLDLSDQHICNVEGSWRISCYGKKEKLQITALPEL